MNPTDSQRPLSLGKRLFIRCFAWGAGCGLILALAMGAVLFYGQRPKAWDTRALRVKRVTAEPLSRLNEKLDEVSSGVSFSVDVENTTPADVTLSTSLTPMGQARNTHALHGSFVKVAREYFLPAHHVTTISLDSDDLCAANHPPQQCFDSYFKDDEALLVFDEAHKYEILMPLPALTLPKDQTTVSPPQQAPTCQNGAVTCQPWERNWDKDKSKLKIGSVVSEQGTVIPPH